MKEGIASIKLAKSQDSKYEQVTIKAIKSQGEKIEFWKRGKRVMKTRPSLLTLVTLAYKEKT